jgi:GT2 family glycosyltransferase
MIVSIIVVSWNSRDDLIALSASLQCHLADHYELIIVDNNSTDDSVAVGRGLPNSLVIPLDENLGFGAANNIGVSHASNDAVALLNPDTRVLDAGLLKLACFALRRRCLCGPRLLNCDQTVQPSCAPVPGHYVAILSALLPHRLLPHSLRRGAVPWLFNDNVQVGWLTGAAIVGPRDVLLELGPFDSSIHMYSEDLDLCIRARQRGHDCYYLPGKAQLVHIGDTASSQRFIDSGLRLSIENRFLTVRRNFGLGRAKIDYCTLAIGLRLRYVVKRALGRDITHEREGLWAFRVAKPRSHTNTKHSTTALILHTSIMSGPAKNFQSRLACVASADDRHVFAPDSGPATDMYASMATLHIRSYSTLTFPSGFLAMIRQGWYLLKDICFFVGRFRALKVRCVISATTYTPAAYIASRLLRIPTIVYCGEIYDKGWLSGPGRSLSGRAFRALVPRLADVIICCSDMVRQQFSQDHRAKVITLYPPISGRSLGQPDEVQLALSDLTPDAVIISVIGMIAPGRGQDVAIEAITELKRYHPNIVLLIAGEPGASSGDRVFLNSLHNLVTELKLNTHVRFLGYVSYVDSLISVSRVVVNPARFNEPFGRVAYEALAIGRPVVLTTVGALGELLKHEETALFVAPDDPVGLADNVTRLLDDPAFGATLVQNAKPIVDSLDQRSNDIRFKQILAGVS